MGPSHGQGGQEDSKVNNIEGLCDLVIIPHPRPGLRSAAKYPSELRTTVEINLSYSAAFFFFAGGNSGIGKDTAVGLAMRGARVIIACRDMEKAEKAVREIKFKSHSLNIFHMELDLANLHSIREFCKSFLQREKRLDILINNAGEDIKFNHKTGDSFGISCCKCLGLA